MKKINVVILDDDPDDRMLLEEALDTGYFNIIGRCATGMELFEYLANNECPDMIIADFYLPGMNSLDIIRRLKLRCESPGFLYVLLSGANTEKDALISTNRHFFDGVLEKPADYQKLIKLNELLINIAREKNILTGEAPVKMINVTDAIPKSRLG